MIDPAGTLGSPPPSLASLFDRDPLSLSRLELSSIVKELRDQRAAFGQAERQAHTEGRSRVKVKAKPTSGGQIDMKSLLDSI